MKRVKSFKTFERSDFYGDLEIEECEETISTIQDMLLELEDSEYDCLVELTPYQWSKKRSWSPEITITINKVGKMTDEEKMDFDDVILSILKFSTSQGYKYGVASGYNQELFLTYTIELFKADL
jgi:hypothetical protein